MTPVAFKYSMQGLMAMTPRGREVTERALEVYWDRLSKQGYADEDLQAGTNRIIDTHHWRAFPTIAELIEVCDEARQARLQRNYEKQKREEDRYRALDPDQMLERGLKRVQNKEVQAAIFNTKALLRGEIDTATWCTGQKLILTDEASQGSIHQIECRLLAKRDAQRQKKEEIERLNAIERDLENRRVKREEARG